MVINRFSDHPESSNPDDCLPLLWDDEPDSGDEDYHYTKYDL